MSVTSPAKISVSVIDDAMVRAVERVFKTMVAKDVTFVEKTEINHLASGGPASWVVGSVGFVGAIDGIVYLAFSEEFAAITTGAILGMSLPEVQMNGPEVVKDAIGELTNMTVGGFKNKLCDIGFRCMLTLPTLLRGKNVSISSIKSATRHIFHFDCEGHRIIADLQVKSD